MAEAAEIQTEDGGQQQQQQQQDETKQRSRLKFWKRNKKSAGKKERPKDASKIGCGGLFRKKKNQQQDDDEPGLKPVAKVSGTVKIETGPSTMMWNSIVRNSMVGTGVFTRAAACSLDTGGVYSRRPNEFTPTVEQVSSLSENFSNREVFSAAGFGVADLLFDLQEETGTTTVLSGASGERQEGVLVTKSKTAMLIGVYTSKLDAALDLINELRDHMTSQGL